MQARRRPDGAFEYGNELYRLEDRERDTFAVRRVRDGEVMGRLRFVDGRSDAETEVEGPVIEADVVRAIARLLDEPRGLLPLQ